MNLIPVKSSNIRAIGYDPTTKTLQVQFPNGLYEVRDVSQAQYDAFMAAESKGAYYNSTFKEFGKVKRL